MTVNDEALIKQRRCIVVMWVGGFDGLMQWSLMCEVHMVQAKGSKFLLLLGLLEYAVHKVSYIYGQSFLIFP